VSHTNFTNPGRFLKYFLQRLRTLNQKFLRLLYVRIRTMQMTKYSYPIASNFGKVMPSFPLHFSRKNQSHKIATALQRNDRSGFSLAEWRRMGLLNVAAVKMLIYKIQDGGWSMRLSDPLCVIAPNFVEIGHTIAIKFLSRKKRNHMNCTQWRSHTNGVRGVRTPCKRKIHHFRAV